MRNFSHPLDDQYVLAGLRAGDPEVVKNWFAAYHDRLLSFVAGKIDLVADAEEIVQETFVNCLKHLPLFRGESGVWTWMVSIAKHEVADYYRKKYAKRAIKTLPLAQELLKLPVDDAQHTAQRVKVVLSQMSAVSVELLMAKYVDGLQVKELAARAGRTVKAIESDLFRARQEFRSRWAVAI